MSSRPLPFSGQGLEAGSSFSSLGSHAHTHLLKIPPVSAQHSYVHIAAATVPLSFCGYGLQGCSAAAPQRASGVWLTTREHCVPIQV